MEKNEKGSLSKAEEILLTESEKSQIKPEPVIFSSEENNESAYEDLKTDESEVLDLEQEPLVDNNLYNEDLKTDGSDVLDVEQEPLVANNLYNDDLKYNEDLQHPLTDNPLFNESDEYNSDEPVDEVPNETAIPDTPKKKKPIKLILGIILPILLIGGLIGGYFWYQYMELKKPIKQDWGQTYYQYLKGINENNNNKKAGLPEGVTKANINFYEVKDIDDPIMVMTYKQNTKEYSNVYYIDNDKVKKIVYDNPTDIELLYNIAKKEYAYYSNSLNDTKHVIIPLKEQITGEYKENDESKNLKFEYMDEEKDSATLTDGKVVEVSKFERSFVKPDVTNKATKYTTTLKEKQLKKTIVRAIDKYKTQAQLITDTVKEQVNKKIQELATKEEQLKSAKADADKKLAEEKKKQAEEEAKKGLKVGDNYLQYGKYKSDAPQYELTAGIYTINKDGSFVYENDWKDANGEIHHTKRIGTYEVKYSEGNAQDKTKAWTIIFTTKSSNEENSQKTDTYDVKESNKFSARQYQNNWTYVK